MLNNTLTVGAFGLRLASQAILLLCAYVWLDPASYQFLLLLSFFASFLSLSDFGFAQLIVKKLDFALQQPKAKVGSTPAENCSDFFDTYFPRYFHFYRFYHRCFTLRPWR